MKNCKKHKIEYDGRKGCYKCKEEELERRAKYNLTLTEAKKILRGISSGELIQLCPDHDEYEGHYGKVTIFKREDIEKIKESWVVPEEGKEIRREYSKRSRARTKIQFFCESCGKMIRSRPDSQAFESFYDGQLEKDEAVELLKKAHNRHIHSDYDIIRMEAYEKNRNKGVSWDEAHYEAKEYARRNLTRD